MIDRAKWFADKLLRSNTPTADSRRQLDWLKVGLVLLMVATAARDKIASLTLPSIRPSVVSVPEPSQEMKRSVEPLSRIKSSNPAAAKVVGDFLAAYAWLIENDDTRTDYDSSSLAVNIERGLESIAAIQTEVGDIDLGPPLNESLVAMWGEENRRLQKDEAANAVFACAWSLTE